MVSHFRTKPMNPFSLSSLVQRKRSGKGKSDRCPGGMKKKEGRRGANVIRTKFISKTLGKKGGGENMTKYRVKGDEKLDWSLGDRSRARGRRQRIFYFIPSFQYTT